MLVDGSFLPIKSKIDRLIVTLSDALEDADSIDPIRPGKQCINDLNLLKNTHLQLKELRTDVLSWEQKMNITIGESQLERLRNVNEALLKKLQNTVRELCIRETQLRKMGTLRALGHWEKLFVRLQDTVGHGRNWKLFVGRFKNQMKNDPRKYFEELRIAVGAPPCEGPKQVFPRIPAGTIGTVAGTHSLKMKTDKIQDTESNGKHPMPDRKKRSTQKDEFTQTVLISADPVEKETSHKTSEFAKNLTTELGMQTTDVLKNDLITVVLHYPENVTKPTRRKSSMKSSSETGRTNEVSKSYVYIVHFRGRTFRTEPLLPPRKQRRPSKELRFEDTSLISERPDQAELVQQSNHDPEVRTSQLRFTCPAGQYDTRLEIELQDAQSAIPLGKAILDELLPSEPNKAMMKEPRVCHLPIIRYEPTKADDGTELDALQLTVELHWSERETDSVMDQSVGTEVLEDVPAIRSPHSPEKFCSFCECQSVSILPEEIQTIMVKNEYQQTEQDEQKNVEELLTESNELKNNRKHTPGIKECHRLPCLTTESSAYYLQDRPMSAALGPIPSGSDSTVDEPANASSIRKITSEKAVQTKRKERVFCSMCGRSEKSKRSEASTQDVPNVDLDRMTLPEDRNSLRSRQNSIESALYYTRNNHVESVQRTNTQPCHSLSKNNLVECFKQREAIRIEQELAVRSRLHLSDTLVTNGANLLADTSEFCMPAIFKPITNASGTRYNPRAYQYFHPPGIKLPRITQPPSMLNLPSVNSVSFYCLAVKK
ncbi:hypothetical protein FGIG_03451 [Fasciola gigantica]|uniref:Uncharacterized protein n=1 Tax=Fasciola gigantica TaxID=46835 RepID=A0A504YCH6_FASGI|nr:hypothetical protein FGIG_03451 [Fasciola gigantica]